MGRLGVEGRLRRRAQRPRTYLAVCTLTLLLAIGALASLFGAAR
jgi:hypothetical protein